MRKLYSSNPLLSNFLVFSALLGLVAAVGANPALAQAENQVDPGQLGVQLPTLGNILTFVIRGFFVVTGLAAMLYLMYGAFSWVTSGGKEDKVADARGRIQAAIVGVVLVFAMLAVITTLEQVVFAKRLCFGLSCPASIPGLAKPCVLGYQLSGTLAQQKTAYQSAMNQGRILQPICCPSGRTNKVGVIYKTDPTALTPGPTVATNIDVCAQ